MSKFDSGLYGMALIDITWFVAYAAIVVGGVGVNALVRELLRRDARYCQQCGYDLAGTIKAGIARCPECGSAITPGAAPQPHDPPA